MSLLIPLTYLLVVAIDAWTDRKRKVNHKRGAIIYSVVSILAGVVIYLLSGEGLLPSAVFTLITRLAWFDFLRNAFAGKHPLYEGLNKPKKERSWWDDKEHSSGIPIIILRVGYICIYIITTSYYLILF